MQSNRDAKIKSYNFVVANILAEVVFSSGGTGSTVDNTLLTT
jgi:ribosomal protein L11 methylase PrmA